MREEKEFIERFNKPSEAIKHFEKLMKSPRPNNDTAGLGYTDTKKGKSSNNGEQRNKKCKNYKPIFHNCGKLGHTTNICRKQNATQNPKQKFKGYYHKCNNKGHQAHECKTKTMRTQRFEGYYQNC